MKIKNLFSHFVFILCIALVILYFGAVNVPSNCSDFSDFSIKKGETLREIASHLEKNGLVSSSALFQFYFRVSGLTKDIRAGYYRFPPHSSITKIAQIITSNQISSDGVLLVVEGTTIKDIEKKLQEKNILSSMDFYRFKVKDFSAVYPDLFNDVPPENNLEGFFFPDSYHLSSGLSEKEIVEMFLNNFSHKVHQLSPASWGNSKISFYQRLIMASILEKEVQSEKDKRMVADILWRRLQENIPLQVDASICYAQQRSFTNCKLTPSSFSIDSPYNTYLHKGLPPTPICNPGLESLEAAFHPLSNDYWYYLTDRKTGKTIFSRTFEEHKFARQKYL